MLQQSKEQTKVIGQKTDTFNVRKYFLNFIQQPGGCVYWHSDESL